MFSIVSYNIRNSWDSDGTNVFLHRIGLILQKLRAEMPDIICFQEMRSAYTDILEGSLPEYTFVFNGRNTDLGGEGLTVALRKATVALRTIDYFWLSPTPDIPGSRFPEQSDCPRICQCTMAQSRKDGSFFRIYNIHLDHISEEARVLGIRQTLEQMVRDYNTMPLPYFLLGDFNTDPQSEVIHWCYEDSPLPLSDLSKDIGGTYHNFGRITEPEQIDFIFSDPKSAKSLAKCVRWTDEANGLYLSDHYPVCAYLDIPALPLL